MPPEGWKSYLDYLDSSSYSMDLLTSNLSPSAAILERQWVKVERMKYSLFPFQQKILDRISGDALVVGLPTGLGKTYVAGAYIARESTRSPCRVLFLTPSIPLGVQQTLFARRMLGLEEAFFISGNMQPERRKSIRVWNAAFTVTTPQTFYNDVLKGHAHAISEAKAREGSVDFLREAFHRSGFEFPFTILVADECHGYIGETDGYSILLAAKAGGSSILALSATPQLHAPSRLRELKKVFGQIEVFSMEEPEIKAHMPERVIGLVALDPPPGLLSVYYQLNDVVRSYQEKAQRLYGAQHARGFCSRHPLCILLISLRMMKARLVEDGASSVLKYGNWKLRELNRPLRELEGKTIYEVYREALRLNYNHKLNATMRILEGERYRKAIVFIESVEGAKQLGSMLHKKLGLEGVAVLVGKGGMSMEQQASALLQFRDRAGILVCTSIGEEGLDVPVADIEVWVDPPSNPKKWIQRFGRILRQADGKKTAKTYALLTSKTHERNKLLKTKAKVEGIYGFTQRIEEEPLPGPLPREQKTLSQFF